MALLEAMAFKKAVISMNVGSISEIIENNKTGYLIDKGKYSEFIKCLKVLKDDSKKRKEFSNKSFNYINNKLNITEYVKKTESLYKNIS